MEGAPARPGRLVGSMLFPSPFSVRGSETLPTAFPGALEALCVDAAPLTGCLETWSMEAGSIPGSPSACLLNAKLAGLHRLTF